MKTIFFFIINIFICSTLYSQNYIDCIPDFPAGCVNNKIEWDNKNIVTFSASTPDGELRYEYDVNIGWSFNGIKVYLPDGPSYYPSYFGGITYYDKNGHIHYPFDNDLLVHRLYEGTIDNYTFKTIWEYSQDEFNSPLVYAMELTMIGKTLKIHVYEIPDYYDNNQAQYRIKCSEFHLDRSEDTPNRKILEIPNLPEMNILLSHTTARQKNDGVFTSIFFDWEKTNSSQLISDYHYHKYFSNTSAYYGQMAYYNKKYPTVMNNRNNLDETIYITVSKNLDETFPNVPNPPSTGIYRQKSIENIVMDYMYWHGTAHTSDQNIVAKLKNDHDITNVWGIYHNWQHHGFDNKFPDQAPANDSADGILKMVELGTQMLGAKYLHSVHENYVLYTDNYSPFCSDDISKNSYGENIEVWEANGHTQYNLRPDKIFQFANNTEYNDIIKMWGGTPYDGNIPNASYLDFHTADNPGVRCDHSSNVTDAAKYVQSIKAYRNLALDYKQKYNGPVSGEGGYFAAYYAGYFDDFSGQINVTKDLGPRFGGFFRPLLVNFDLKELHPKVFMHGVGYVERFFYQGSEVNGSDYAYYQGRTQDSMLMYTATILAYGHGGQFKTYDPIDRLNDLWGMFYNAAEIQYKHVLPMHSLYGNASVTSITYRDPNTGYMWSASDYIRLYPDSYNDFDSKNFMSQLKIVYDNGTTVYVNRNPYNTWNDISIPSGRSFYNYHGFIDGVEQRNAGATYPPGSSITLSPSNGFLCFSGYNSEPETDNLKTANPFRYELKQNYPNPFNPSTKIQYTIEKAGLTKLIVYDILGREVKSLVNKFEEPGYYDVVLDATNLATGVYFYKLINGHFIETRKMILIK